MEKKAGASVSGMPLLACFFDFGLLGFWFSPCLRVSLENV
jgi:hypothetical protein